MKFKVEGMSCQGCVSSLQKGLEQLEGVEKVEVTLTPGEAVVEGAIGQDAILTAIDELGFTGTYQE